MFKNVALNFLIVQCTTDEDNFSSEFYIELSLLGDYQYLGATDFDTFLGLDDDLLIKTSTTHVQLNSFRKS